MPVLIPSNRLIADARHCGTLARFRPVPRPQPRPSRGRAQARPSSASSQALDHPPAPVSSAVPLFPARLRVRAARLGGSMEAKSVPSSPARSPGPARRQASSRRSWTASASWAAPNSAFPRATRLGWCAPRSGPGVGFGYTAMASISRQVTDTRRSSRAGSAVMRADPVGPRSHRCHPRKVVMSGYRRRLTGRRTSPETRGTARWRCSAIQRRPANSSLTVIAARRSTSHPRQGCGPVSAVPEAIASRHVLGRYNGQVGRLSQGHLPLVQIASIGRAL